MISLPMITVLLAMGLILIIVATLMWLACRPRPLGCKSATSVNLDIEKQDHLDMNKNDKFGYGVEAAPNNIETDKAPPPESAPFHGRGMSGSPNCRLNKKRRSRSFTPTRGSRPCSFLDSIHEVEVDDGLEDNYDVSHQQTYSAHRHLSELNAVAGSGLDPAHTESQESDFSVATHAQPKLDGETEENTKCDDPQLSTKSVDRLRVVRESRPLKCNEIGSDVTDVASVVSNISTEIEPAVIYRAEDDIVRSASQSIHAGKGFRCRPASPDFSGIWSADGSVYLDDELKTNPEPSSNLDAGIASVVSYPEDEPGAIAKGSHPRSRSAPVRSRSPVTEKKITTIWDNNDAGLHNVATSRGDSSSKSHQTLLQDRERPPSIRNRMGMSSTLDNCSPNRSFSSHPSQLESKSNCFTDFKMTKPQETHPISFQVRSGSGRLKAGLFTRLDYAHAMVSSTTPCDKSTVAENYSGSQSNVFAHSHDFQSNRDTIPVINSQSMLDVRTNVPYVNEKEHAEYMNTQFVSRELLTDAIIHSLPEVSINETMPSKTNSHDTKKRTSKKSTRSVEHERHSTGRNSTNHVSSSRTSTNRGYSSSSTSRSVQTRPKMITPTRTSTNRGYSNGSTSRSVQTRPEMINSTSRIRIVSPSRRNKIETVQRSRPSLYTAWDSFLIELARAEDTFFNPKACTNTTSSESPSLGRTRSVDDISGDSESQDSFSTGLNPV